MIFNLKFEPYQIKENTQFFCKVDGQNDFPVLMIDKDSYIVKATVETGLDFQGKDMVYNLQIGKYSSLAEDIFFMININHDYRSVFQGCIKELRNFSEKEIRIKRKGQILIANDCWVGHGAMIMSGVTIHNGAVVAANAVVTKDVPPYAVVAGNPAKVVKYRFTQKEISALLKIAWWEWNTEKLKSCVKDFMGEVSEFIQKHIEAAEADLIKFTQRKNPIQRLIDGGVFMLFV